MNKMRRLYRIGALAAAILLPVSAVLAIGIPAASAASGQQFCYIPQGEGGPHACLNSWGGGPWVNVSTNDNTQNNDFTIVNEPNGNIELKDTGGNGWSGHCIGDAYNESGKADTSLDACGTNGNGAGWGTQFEYISGGSCGEGEVSFYNVHWHDYLGPPSGWVNGSHFYLNKPGQICFLYSNFVNG
jgi:hypothetical protein